MDKVNSKLIVYFEEPFWIGAFEKTEGGKLYVTKITFGSEPKDYEVYELLIKHYYRLRLSLAVTTVVNEAKRNPKRIQRDVKMQLQIIGIGTKSQQALKLQQEQIKQKRKIKSKQQKIIEEKHRFELKQQKKKVKHREH